MGTAAATGPGGGQAETTHTTALSVVLHTTHTVSGYRWRQSPLQAARLITYITSTNYNRVKTFVLRVALERKGHGGLFYYDD